MTEPFHIKYQTKTTKQAATQTPTIYTKTPVQSLIILQKKAMLEKRHL